MSVESAKMFVEKVKNDEDFRAKLSSFQDGQERMDFAKAEGFDFTVAEINEVTGEELTEDELEAVSGGGPSACGKVCAKWVGGASADVSL